MINTRICFVFEKVSCLLVTDTCDVVYAGGWSNFRRINPSGSAKGYDRRYANNVRIVAGRTARFQTYMGGKKSVVGCNLVRGVEYLFSLRLFSQLRALSS